VIGIAAGDRHLWQKKSLLPVAVITLVAVVSTVQVVQDVYQSRPTIRFADPEI